MPIQLSDLHVQPASENPKWLSLHSLQVMPVTPGLHWHWPESASHTVPGMLPTGLQLHLRQPALGSPSASAHLPHVLPTYPGLHKHCPLKGSQADEREPSSLQSQATERNRHF